MSTWTISLTDAGSRLDHFLVANNPTVSRSQIQKIIKSEQVTVNGKKAMVHRFLKENDIIEWKDEAPEEKTPLKEKRFGSRSKPARERAAKKLAISGPVTSSRKPLTADLPTPILIEETADWMVIDKPIGLLVHADSVHQESTLVDWALAHDPNIAKVGEDPVRPGIIHRLDREVSGLMIIAKTQDAYDSFRAQFRDRIVKKTYLALVHGVIEKDEGDIKFRIARSNTSARMAARPSQEEEGKAAWTHFSVLERFRGATLVELEILSGRTHQIRAHLHALGRPVIGDTLYALKKTDRNVKPPRLMLQSIRLRFQDPSTQEEKSFVLAADPAFDALVQEFRVS
ncbi:RluA family pseudouridine synthase [Patescibacteria group bacterium]|nr:RluA family pseudouridine synthase [Patescibacteria group bacterium]MBP9710619.1 RluA family pseudouridine synthase [Patescibacteria group bacterium]